MANEEHLPILKQEVEPWSNCIRVGNPVGAAGRAER